MTRPTTPADHDRDLAIALSLAIVAASVKARRG